VCTVSVVPVHDGFRLACNRDERRGRPAAGPPRVRSSAARTSIWPRDPQSGGTWIGANDAGLAIALLNRSGRGGERVDRAPTTSRGTIIPRLLECAGIDDAVEHACLELDGVKQFEPCMLVIVQSGRLAVVDHGAPFTFVAEGSLTRPVVFTSSSLGDEVVRAPRHRLFAVLVESSRSPLTGQTRFHRHRWRRRPEISVCMARHDAATLSRTVVDVRGSVVQLRYTPLCDGLSGPDRR
jgi:hypothetical protein